MKLKFLAPPVSLALLFLGLSFADAAGPAPRVPQKVEIPESFTRDGVLLLAGSTDFYQACESFWGFEARIEEDRVLIASYVDRSSEICADRFQPGNRLVYEVTGLNPAHAYSIFFLNEKGSPVFAGVVPPEESPLLSQALTRSSD